MSGNQKVSQNIGVHVNPMCLAELYTCIF